MEIGHTWVGRGGREEESKRQRKGEAGRLISQLSGQDREPLAASLADSGLASTCTLLGMGNSFPFQVAWFVVRLSEVSKFLPI